MTDSESLLNQLNDTSSPKGKSGADQGKAEVEHGEERLTFTEAERQLVQALSALNGLRLGDNPAISQLQIIANQSLSSYNQHLLVTFDFPEADGMVRNRPVGMVVDVLQQQRASRELKLSFGGESATAEWTEEKAQVLMLIYNALIGLVRKVAKQVGEGKQLKLQLVGLANVLQYFHQLFDSDDERRFGFDETEIQQLETNIGILMAETARLISPAQAPGAGEVSQEMQPALSTAEVVSNDGYVAALESLLEALASGQNITTLPERTQGLLYEKLGSVFVALIDVSNRVIDGDQRQLLAEAQDLKAALRGDDEAATRLTGEFLQLYLKKEEGQEVTATTVFLENESPGGDLEQTRQRVEIELWDHDSQEFVNFFTKEMSDSLNSLMGRLDDINDRLKVDDIAQIILGLVKDSSYFQTLPDPFMKEEESEVSVQWRLTLQLVAREIRSQFHQDRFVEGHGDTQLNSPLTSVVPNLSVLGSLLKSNTKNARFCSDLANSIFSKISSQHGH